MWPESLSSDLPPPRADEPASLRQDIADELADHLAAAVADERARGAEEAAAREAALNRFGDPAAVARQLWLEAMKEPIMRQRTLMVALALLVLGVFAANGLAWMAFRQLKASNEALAAQLESASSKDEWGQFADLTVKLVNDDAAATPVEGYPVQFWGTPVERVNRRNANGGDPGYGKMMIEEKTNSAGTVRYAPVLPGIYQVKVTAPTGWELNRDVSLLARPWTETIVVPSAPPETANVKVEFARPAELQDERLLYLLSFSSIATTKSGDWEASAATWYTWRNQNGNVIAPPDAVLGSSSSPDDHSRVTVGVYDATVRVILRLANDNGPEYVPGPDVDLKKSRFEAKPGDNTWRIALTPRGIERVREALAKAASASDSTE